MAHIANVLTYLADKYGGPPKSAKSCGEALVALGQEVSYWGTASDDEMRDLRRSLRHAQGFPVSWPTQWYRAPDLPKSLKQHLSRIDVLHLHEIWGHPIQASAKIAVKCRKPYLIAPRGTFMQPWRYTGLKKTIYRNLFVNRMFSGASCLHAVTSQEIDGFRLAGYRGPVTIVPNGVNAAEFSEISENNPFEVVCPSFGERRVVLFLSRLSREKGLDQLIPAFADVLKRDSYDDTVLVLAGPDDRGYGSTVRGLVERFDLGKSVVLTGMVMGREKLALISRADIYVLPSYSEGFSNSLLENLAAGKPVIITPDCNFPEVVEEGAGLCVPPEMSALSEGLRKLLDMSDADRRAMGRRGSELVLKNYTWDIAARKLITVYDAILRGKSIPLYPEPAPLDQNGNAVL